MTRLTWGSPGQKTFEAGVDRGVFYPPTGSGIPWNGLTSVVETTEDDPLETIFLDGRKIIQRRVAEQFAIKIEAFTYPVEFEEYDGVSTSHRQKPFGFSYRTSLGDDLNGINLGHRLHIVYNLKTQPYDQSRETLDTDVSANTFSWECVTTPLNLESVAPTAHIVVDTSLAWHEALTALENVLYGTPTTSPRLPSPQEALSIFENNTTLKIIDHGDGSWTALGPDDVVSMLGASEFQINWSSAVYLDDVTYRVSSY